MRKSKYNAKKCKYDGYIYDSQLEAAVAYELDLRLRAGEIKDWERQHKVEMWAYDSQGIPKIKTSHKVDFLIHENDGKFTLHEAKGFETQDYRNRIKWLKKLWLPDHPEYSYVVQRKVSNIVMRGMLAQSEDML